MKKITITDSTEIQGMHVTRAIISNDGMYVLISTSNLTSGTSDVLSKIYVYIKSDDDYIPYAELVAEDGCIGDYFGSSISISDDNNYIAIGAWSRRSTFTSSFYVFVKSGSTWIQQAKIVSPELNQIGYGASIAISGDGNYIAVSAYMYSSYSFIQNGAVYIYARTEEIWSYQAMLLANDPYSQNDGYSQFGMSLSMSFNGDIIIIGSPGEPSAQDILRTIYIFTRSENTWTKQTEIQSDEQELRDTFGCSVTISSDGTRISIGAPFMYDSDQIGSYYIFNKSEGSWMQYDTKITSSDIAAGDYFGIYTAMTSSGNHIIASAMSANNYSGAIYVFG